MSLQPPPSGDDAERTVTAATGAGVVVTTHHLATDAAVGILRSGGNAVDAAIAANAVLGVVLPDTCGPGGDLFALVHRPGMDAPAALNASGRAGSGSSAAQLRAAGHEVVPLRGAAPVTVPGCVDGWEALLDRFGTMSPAQVLGPAIASATDGFPVSAELADSLAALAGVLRGQPSARALYPGGSPPQPGDVITRPDIARTLTAVAYDGRDAFYRGSVGSAIQEVTGGVIAGSDLDVVQAEWVEPIRMDVFGLTAWTVPPNSQGHLVLTAAWLAERILDGVSPGSDAWHHGLIEAYRAVAWERDLLTTDPGTAPLSNADLVSPARLEARLARISMDAATPWPSSRPVPGGTMYLCVRDHTGLGISLIQSNFHGIGAALGAGDTGVFLHNRGAGFTLEPGHRNELAARRRPLHTLSPTLWTERDELRLLLGTRGGQYQPQLLLQVAADRLVGRSALPAALAAPRWIVDQWGPDESHVVTVERRLDARSTDALRRRGHSVETAGEWQRGWGPVAAIEIERNAVVGASDPRVSTSSAAVTAERRGGASR